MKMRGDRFVASQTGVEEFMANTRGIVALMVGLLAFSVPLFAHHGTASFDTTKTLMLKGVVAEYIWSNPHVIVKLDVKDDSGNLTQWVIEAWNPVTQTARGWTKNSFKPGDEVSADVTPAKNDRTVGEFRGRIVVNGKVLQEGR
jgi:Family of unknown function (DUF6152)